MQRYEYIWEIIYDLVWKTAWAIIYSIYDGDMRGIVDGRIACHCNQFDKSGVKNMFLHLTGIYRAVSDSSSSSKVTYWISFQKNEWNWNQLISIAKS